MPAQIIEKNGRREFAVLPYREYLRMQRKVEDYDDLRALREAKVDPRNSKRRPLIDYMRERGITP
ncbi:MAG: type II toxin-antitoxin system Phd/YefM family antitoxin [Opitutus sp.]|nr:type II toxin-antitoxin system Phd/YefM family antitoxin [Opitutus sp.]